MSPITVINAKIKDTQGSWQTSFVTLFAGISKAVSLSAVVTVKLIGLASAG